MIKVRNLTRRDVHEGEEQGKEEGEEETYVIVADPENGGFKGLPAALQEQLEKSGFDKK